MVMQNLPCLRNFFQAPPVCEFEDPFSKNLFILQFYLNSKVEKTIGKNQKLNFNRFPHSALLQVMVSLPPPVPAFTAQCSLMASGWGACRFAG